MRNPGLPRDGPERPRGVAAADLSDPRADENFTLQRPHGAARAFPQDRPCLRKETVVKAIQCSGQSFAHSDILGE